MRLDPELIESEYQPSRPLGKFAKPPDYAECRRLHRQHGTTYYFATQCLGPRIRTRVHALYGFVRVPDEWVDEPSNLSVVRRRRMLSDYRNQLIRGLDGVCPDSQVLRAFCDVMHEAGLALDEPLRFLDSMEQDLSVSRYPTYDSLRQYMRGSASAVGIMMCTMLEAGEDRQTLEAAAALGEAMQLTNFLRDVGEDAGRGRIYLPKEDLDRFGVSEADILAGRVSGEFIELLRFEIERARMLFSRSDVAITILPRRAGRAVKLARRLYARILDHIETNHFDVFRHRARTSQLEKFAVLAQVMIGRAD